MFADRRLTGMNRDVRIAVFAMALVGTTGLHAQATTACSGAAVLALSAAESGDGQESGRAGAPTGKPNPLEDPRDRIYYPGDTEAPMPLARKMLGNILLDQKQIWTSPFHMNRGNAKWWILFGGATAGLIASDKYIENRIAHSQVQRDWGSNVSRIGAVYTVIPVVAGFYAAGVLADNDKARETGVLGAEALLDSLVVSEVIKVAAGRNRPNSTKEPSQFFDGGASFPSGHAIESWSLATVVAGEYHATKWVPIVAYGLAGTVSVARFFAQQHYASDVVAGAAMGWFIGHYVYRTHMDHAIHKHPAAFAPTVIPEFQPSSRTYAVALSWGHQAPR